MKVEAAYFTTTPTGERGGFIVCDLQDSSQIPAIAEPLFLAFNAKMLSNQPDHRLAGLNL
jgi:hypothetical protein